MNKTLVIFLVFSVVFCSAFIVLASGNLVPSTNEIICETFTPGTNNTYRNDDLGISFKYPRKWFIEKLPHSTMSVWLTNYDSYKISSLPDMKKYKISCIAYQDIEDGINTAEDRLFIMANKEFGGRSGKINGTVGWIKVRGGKIYLIRVVRADDLNKQYEVGIMYISNKKHKYLVYFFPYQVPNREAYLRILKSVEMY